MRALIYVFVFVAGGLSLATVATSQSLVGMPTAHAASDAPLTATEN